MSDVHRFPGGMVSPLFIRLKAATVAGLLVSSAAMATTNELTAELKSVKKLRVTALLQGISSLHKTEQDGRDANARILIAPSYPLSDDYRATLSGALIQNFNQEQLTEVSNAKFSVSRKPLQLTQDTVLIAAGGFRLPTNEIDRRDNKFNGSLQLEPQMITAFNVRGFNFSMITALSAVKNFHTYDRNNVGKANTSYSLAPYLGFEAYILKNVVLTLDGDYTYARSYQDTPRTLFSLGQSLTYEQPAWSATLGHTNAANALQYNGADSNISIFDENTSTIYGQLRVIY